MTAKALIILLCQVFYPNDNAKFNKCQNELKKHCKPNGSVNDCVYWSVHNYRFEKENNENR